MSSENTVYFTKDNLDTYLKELAKEFRKLNETAIMSRFTLPLVKKKRNPRKYLSASSKTIPALQRSPM